MRLQDISACSLHSTIIAGQPAGYTTHGMHISLSYAHVIVGAPAHPSSEARHCVCGVV